MAANRPSMNRVRALHTGRASPMRRPVAPVQDEEEKLWHNNAMSNASFHTFYFGPGNPKYFGSPRKLQKKVKDKHSTKSLQIHDVNELESHILHGWYFDCTCGMKGTNYDDGKVMIQCDVCKAWQHTKCNGLPARKEDIMIAMRTRRVWVCPACKAGNFKFRSTLWALPEDSSKDAKEHRGDDAKEHISGSPDLSRVASDPSLHNMENIALPTSNEAEKIEKDATIRSSAKEEERKQRRRKKEKKEKQKETGPDSVETKEHTASDSKGEKEKKDKKEEKKEEEKEEKEEEEKKEEEKKEEAEAEESPATLRDTNAKRSRSGMLNRRASLSTTPTRSKSGSNLTEETDGSSKTKGIEFPFIRRLSLSQMKGKDRSDDIAQLAPQASNSSDGPSPRKNTFMRRLSLTHMKSKDKSDDIAQLAPQASNSSGLSPRKKFQRRMSIDAEMGKKFKAKLTGRSVSSSSVSEEMGGTGSSGKSRSPRKKGRYRTKSTDPSDDGMVKGATNTGLSLSPDAKDSPQRVSSPEIGLTRQLSAPKPRRANSTKLKVDKAAAAKKQEDPEMVIVEDVDVDVDNLQSPPEPDAIESTTTTTTTPPSSTKEDEPKQPVAPPEAVLIPNQNSAIRFNRKVVVYRKLTDDEVEKVHNRAITALESAPETLSSCLKPTPAEFKPAPELPTPATMGPFLPPARNSRIGIAFKRIITKDA